MSRFSIKARWIVPVAGPPIANGCLQVEDGRIVSVGRAELGSACDVDYGDAAILPGFVNAHTHLDLTAFRGCVPYMGAFTDWIRILVSQQTAQGAEERMDRGVQVGLVESLAAGVTCIADIGCGERAATAWTAAAANVVGFFEAIGMGPRRFDSHPRSLRQSLEWCEQVRNGSGGQVGPRGDGGLLITAISPHAPYSTAPEVYREVMRYARERSLPLTTHLAETRDEAEFLTRGTGPFRRLLEERGLWDGSFAPPGCSPVQYGETLGLLACRPVLAHVNYVDERDIELLSENRCSVAYCPRTHRFFEHAPHPYPRMLARGVNVCIGTDSLASAPSLSILEELRFLRQIDGNVSDDALLEMGTLRGARAFGLEAHLGSLEPGKRADLVILPLAASAMDPTECILRDRTVPTAVYVSGRCLTSRG